MTYLAIAACLVVLAIVGVAVIVARLRELRADLGGE